MTRCKVILSTAVIFAVIALGESSTELEETKPAFPMYPDLGCHSRITEPIYLQLMNNWCLDNYMNSTLRCFKGCVLERLGILFFEEQNLEAVLRVPGDHRYEYAVMTFKLYFSLGEDEDAANAWLLYLFAHCPSKIQTYNTIEDLKCEKWEDFFNCVQEGINLVKCEIQD